MNNFDTELSERLADLREQGLYRELRRVDSPQSPHLQVQGQALLSFASNDYLGLANDPALKAAAIHAVERFGAGAGSSRLICGSLAPHQELEETIAAFKGTEAALSFATGYAAASGAICALMGPDDIIIVDKLVHACIVDAARLCGAKLRVFRHNDLNDLEKILKWAGGRGHSPKPKVQGPTQAAEDCRPGIGRVGASVRARRPRTVVVTESVFSMDGDHAPLPQILELKNRYGAWLMVDEAHATGLYGVNRRGLAEEMGISDQIEIQMGTLGKAFGAAGGYLCGSRALIDYLVNRARSFIFSTAPVPASAAAATAGIRFVQSSAGEQRRRLLWQHVAELAARPDSKDAAGNASPRSLHSAIVPIPIGRETLAVEMATALRERGLFIPAIRYPTVARGAARLRLTLTAAHSRQDLEQLRRALGHLGLQAIPAVSLVEPI